MIEPTQIPNSNVAQSLSAVATKLTQPDKTRAKASETNPQAVKGRRKHNATRKTKASSVEKLLQRKTGATLEQIGKVTSWQPHTCRAFLSGLRKKGREIVRETNAAKKSVYRITPNPKKDEAS